MLEYNKKKILLQSGGTRNFYYKVTSNGKKKQISKIEYLNKKGGEPPENYILITVGPTGSGKSSLIDKSLKYLKLERPLDKNIFIIDNLVEENPEYKKRSKEILEEYFSNSNMNAIEQKLKNQLITPVNNKNNIFKKFTNAYFNIRDKGINDIFNQNIRLTISKNESFIIETTGRSFPTIIGWTSDKYKVFISYSLVEFCTLIDRNIKRMIVQIKSFKSNNSLAPRLPNMRIEVFGEIVNTIIDKLIKIIDKCNSGNCKTNSNFDTSTQRNFRLIIFDNTTRSDEPFFDSDDKSKNLDEIKELIMTRYKRINSCNK
jgi:hypothetical protein